MESSPEPSASDEDEKQSLHNTGEEIATIVVAIDASNGASRVISNAARVSRSLPAAVVHVAHVFRTSRTDRARVGAPVPSADDNHDAKEHLESHVRAARRQCRNQVIGHFLVGDPTAEILGLLDELGAELLVVGTHDHTAWERLLLGSITEALVRKAGCSVLVIRPTKRHK
jgi:nucleotide-binding universal stress UspA family protein